MAMHYPTLGRTQRLVWYGNALILSARKRATKHARNVCAKAWGVGYSLASLCCNTQGSHAGFLATTKACFTLTEGPCGCINWERKDSGKGMRSSGDTMPLREAGAWFIMSSKGKSLRVLGPVAAQAKHKNTTKRVSMFLHC
jgi:hypothetical protein